MANSQRYFFEASILAALFVLFASVNLLAQKEDHIWISNFSSVDSCETSILPQWCGSSLLDFNVLPPAVYHDPKLTLDFLECNTSICDENGELLLYCNAQSIHGETRHWIENGKIVNYSPKWEWLTWENENGATRPTGFRIPQGAGLIPVPEKVEEYWVLYGNYENNLPATDSSNNELWASYVMRDMEDRLRVVKKDTVINDRIGRMGNLSACKHGNGRDWWLLQFNKDTVYTYLIDPSGINLDHIQKLPFKLRSTLGQVKFSQKGDQFALYGTVDYNEPGGADFLYAGFDRCTGDLEAPEYHQLFGNGWLNSGVEFSPDGTLLYLSNKFELFQLDLTAESIIKSKLLVAEYSEDSCYIFSPEPIDFSQLQLAPDHKIYLGISGQCDKMHRIENPNLKGSECELNQSAITLNTYISGTIPTFNTYRLGPLDGSSCDTLDLDNNPISRFWYEQDSIDYLSVQFWDVSYFRPEEWEWNFGDGSASFERFPLHQYNSNGTYEVCLKVTNENSINTSCQILQLGPSATTIEKTKYNISIFPNPVQEQVRLLISDYLPQDAIFYLYDSFGKIAFKQKVIGGENYLQLASLSDGPYFFELKDLGNTIGSGKLVKI